MKSDCSNINRVGQKLMKAADAEGLASARAVTACIQPFNDLFDAKRAGFSVAMEVKFKDQSV